VAVKTARKAKALPKPLDLPAVRAGQKFFMSEEISRALLQVT